MIFRSRPRFHHYHWHCKLFLLKNCTEWRVDEEINGQLYYLRNFEGGTGFKWKSIKFKNKPQLDEFHLNKYPHYIKPWFPFIWGLFWI